MKNDIVIPSIAWILLTAICLVFIIVGVKAALKRTGWQKSTTSRILTRTIIALIGWGTLLSILSYYGFFSDFGLVPPRPALAMLVPLPIVLIIALSKKGTEFLQAVPQQWIIWMQSFRIFVELLLLLAFLKNMLPVQMTLEGMNFDIISGLLALTTGYIIARKKPYATKIAIAFNIIGFLLLLNILIIAVLSMPTSIRYFMNEPANTIVGQFPFIFLPGILVPMAYTLHIFSLRQLSLNAKAKSVVQLTPAA